MVKCAYSCVQPIFKIVWTIGGICFCLSTWSYVSLDAFATLLESFHPCCTSNVKRGQIDASERCERQV